MENKHTKKSAAAGEDLISKFPDEIIHSIIAGEDLISKFPDEIIHSIIDRIPCPKQAAQTSTLSKRWGDVWCSDPVVEFDPKMMKMELFEEFANATMKRFSGDRLLRMEELGIWIEPGKNTTCSPPIEKLLDLASKRKAEDVTIQIWTEDVMIHLPFELLSNSSAKNLRLGGIRFVSNKNGDDHDLLVPMNSLRWLVMSTVAFETRGFLQI